MLIKLYMKSYDDLIDELLELSFAEDIGDGDHYAVFLPMKWENHN